MPDEPAQALALSLVTATTTLLKWEWDGRFNAGLTVFEKAQVDAVTQALQPIFAKTLDPSMAKDAPPPVRERVATMGGMRGDQRLLLSDECDGAWLAAAWWPWGSGQKVSLRVIVIGAPDAVLKDALAL